MTSPAARTCPPADLACPCPHARRGGCATRTKRHAQSPALSARPLREAAVTAAPFRPACRRARRRSCSPFPEVTPTSPPARSASSPPCSGWTTRRSTCAPPGSTAAGRGDPSDLRAVLTDAAARRPAGAPCAVVIPLIATVNPPVIRRLREAVAASGMNAVVSGFINSNAMIAEVLHIRLAEAGLARADRVRLFSIVTAADGILIATAAARTRAASANVTSVLLAARLALPVITASLDSAPSVHEGAMRLKEMGVNRLAIAPCFIGPEATASDLDTLAIGAECAAPIGAHGNIAKLAAMAYGQAISQLDIPVGGERETGTDSTSNRRVRCVRINQQRCPHILANRRRLAAS